MKNLNEAKMKAFDIWKDDLGRWCVHNADSQFDRDSDHGLYGTKKEAEKAAAFYKENGCWPD